MNKLILLLGLLLVIPNAHGSAEESWTSLNFSSSIQSFEPVYNDEYKISLSTEEAIHIFNKSHKLRTLDSYPPTGNMSSAIIDGETKWIGAQESGSNVWKVFNEEETFKEGYTNHRIANLGLAEDRIFVSTELVFSKMIDFERNWLWFTESTLYSYQPSHYGELPGLDKEGFLVTNYYNHVNALTDQKEFQNLDVDVGKFPEANVYKDYYLAHGTDGFELFDHNKNTIQAVNWNATDTGFAGKGYIFSANANKIKKYDVISGEHLDTYHPKNTPKDLEVLTDEKLAVLKQNSTLILDIETFEKQKKLEKGGQEISVVSDPEDEFIFSIKDNNTLHFSRQSVYQDFPVLKENFSFYVSDKEGYKAISSGNGVKIGDPEEKTDDEFKVGEGGSNDFNKDFDVNKSAIYASDEDSAVWVAPLAKHKNKTITFNKDKADVILDSYNETDLIERLINHSNPNHVVAGNLVGDQKLFAAEHASKVGSIPINTTEEKLESDLDKVFNQIGINEEIALNGRYVSLVGIGLTEEEIDNEIYGSTETKTISQIREKGYKTGYFPENASLSSKMLSNMKEKDISNISVSATYLSGNTPVIAGTFGGGVRQGVELHGSIDETYDSELFIEQRSDPAEFILSITPETLITIAETGDEIEDIFSEIIAGSVGALFSHLYIVLQGINYFEETLYLHLEHDWTTIEFQPTAFINEFDLENLSDSDEISKEIQKEVLNSILATFWPDQYSSIQNLDQPMKHDLNFYIGVGNNNEWKLPEEKDGWFSNPYKNKTKLSEVSNSPRILWDSTKTKPDSTKLRNAVEKGTSHYVSYTRHPESSHNSNIVELSASYSDSIGGSISTATKKHSKDPVIQKIGPATSKSLILYGNPESAYLNLNNQKPTNNVNCNGRKCQVSLEIEPSEIQEESIIINSPGQLPSETLMYEHSIPENADINSETLQADYKETDRRIPRLNHSLRTDGSYEVIEESPTNSHKFAEDGSVSIRKYRKKNGELKVLDRAHYSVVYESDFTAETFTEDNKVFLRLNKPEHSKPKVFIEANNLTKQEKIDQKEKTVEIPIKEIREEKLGIDLVVESNDTIVYENKLYARPDPELRKNIDLEEISLLGTGEAQIQVENPSDREARIVGKIQTSDNIMLMPGEESLISQSLDPEETSSITKSLIAIDSGDGWLQVGENNKTLEISDHFENKKVKPGEIRKSFSDKREQVRLRMNGSEWSYSLDKDQEKMKFNDHVSFTKVSYHSDGGKLTWKSNFTHECFGDDNNIICNSSKVDESVENFEEIVQAREIFRAMREKVGS